MILRKIVVVFIPSNYKIFTTSPFKSLTHPCMPSSPQTLHLSRPFLHPFLFLLHFFFLRTFLLIGLFFLSRTGSSIFSVTVASFSVSSSSTMTTSFWVVVSSAVSPFGGTSSSSTQELLQQQRRLVAFNVKFLNSLL